MNKSDKDFLVQKIRTQYTEKENTELDALRALDRKVKRSATVFSYIFGSISAIIMGAGMSLVMTDIGKTIGIENPMMPGIVIGVIGIVPACLSYPLYNRTLKKERDKIAPEILRLSDELMK